MEATRHNTIPVVLNGRFLVEPELDWVGSGKAKSEGRKKQGKVASCKEQRT